MLEWSSDFEDMTVRTVARSRSIYGELVSTVWLGLDHSWGIGSPLIFETVVFGWNRSTSDTYRYATEAEALAGHRKLLRQCLIPPPLRKVFLADWR